MPIAIVTGASAGIGLETAKGLAKKNFDLILVSRSLKKLNSIKYDLETQYSINCDVFSYDLSLIKSNIKKPNQADTLNYLGFTTRKLGDFENGEKYYLLGLEIDPNHVGINEYLGELYVVTNRLDLAKERLKVLESCNCEEYNELKDIIDGVKESKY